MRAQAAAAAAAEADAGGGPPPTAVLLAAAAAELGAELQPLAWDGRAFRGVSWVD